MTDLLSIFSDLSTNPVGRNGLRPTTVRITRSGETLTRGSGGPCRGAATASLNGREPKPKAVPVMAVSPADLRNFLRLMCGLLFMTLLGRGSDAEYRRKIQQFRVTGLGFRVVRLNALSPQQVSTG